MPKTPSYKLSVSNINESGFTLHSVVMRPRHCTPLDLETAASNLRIEGAWEANQSAPPPPDVLAKMAHYLLTDFFVLAHRTGLYNRQPKVWESLASISEIQITLLQQGLFKKTELPIWDFSMLDRKGRSLLMVRLVQNVPHPDIDIASERGCKVLLTTLIQRIERYRAECALFCGAFLVCPRPVSEFMKTAVENLTGGDDPIGKYEAKLSTLPEICLDLFEYDDVNTDETDNNFDEYTKGFSLVHPSLQRAKTSKINV